MLSYRLPNRLPGEKVIKVLRKDFFILFKKILVFFLLAFLPLALGYLMISVYPDLLSGEISYPLIALSASAYYLFVWLFFFFSFIDYYLDIWIITNERIIDVKQEGFFARTISEQRLYRIQDVTSEIHGFWPTIFKFGNIYVQTAGSKQRFFFEEIRHPGDIRDLIISLAEKSKAKHKTENA